ncbi:MAG: glycosyl hydrolase family 32 [Muribaculaceae bacterium]
MQRRDFLKSAGLAFGSLLLPKISIAQSVNTPTTKYVLSNGIALPGEWPPHREMAFEPMPVPYLDNIPDVIPIDCGRQLFVDKFLIHDTNLRRTAHKPRKSALNPVLKPETPDELDGMNHIPGATAKDGGVWWDPQDGIFKMWYEAGWLNHMAYATSLDGIHWTRPDLGIVPGTNLIVPDIVADSSTVWLDHFTDQADQRFKMFLRSPNGVPGIERRFLTGNCMVSADGIHWSAPVETGKCGDRSTIFYNPFTRKWVYSIRNTGDVEKCPVGRCRMYHESDDFMQGAHWDYNQLGFWIGADYLDQPDPYIGDRPQLYNLSATPYESIMVALPQIHLGPKNELCKAMGVPKITELKVAYSRDGYSWDRTDRDVFIAAERKSGAWDRGYVQSVGGICNIVGDELWFYYIGFSGCEQLKGKEYGQNGMHYNGCTGIAALRRDGFVSLDAGNDGGVVTTRKVRFSGKHLFVNVNCPHGQLRTEVLDADGRIISGFSADESKPVSADSTIVQVKWRHARLESLAGQIVRFRFHLTSGELYSFWVSGSENGESGGYTAAGGPGFTGGIDTEGLRAYKAAKNCVKLL